MLPQSLVDTHCHLDFHVFTSDRSEVVKRARETGVVRIINPGIDLKSSQTAIELASVFPAVLAAVGVHPNDLHSIVALRDGILQEMIKHDKVVAVGEIGLDYYWNRTPRDLQIMAFEMQLGYAGDAGLPVIIHNRQASQDIISILSTWHSSLKSKNHDLAKRPGVLHSFSGTINEAQQVVEMGFFVGITGPVTFKKSTELHDLVRVLPLEYILVETDSPFLTPHPWRGRRNEPSFVKYTVEKIADLRGLPFEEIAEITTANARRLFNWREPF